MKNLQKGFTLIELLVVIAIIGILSSVVLASLTSARTKGQDAAVQSTLSNMRAQAELYYSTNVNSYGPASTACTGSNMFGTTTTSANGLKALVDGAESQNGSSINLVCSSTATAWAVSSALPSGNGAFCVDSKGNAIATSSAHNTANTACN